MLEYQHNERKTMNLEEFRAYVEAQRQASVLEAVKVLTSKAGATNE